MSYNQKVYRFRAAGYSVDYLVDFSVTTDLKNSSRRILDLDQPGLGMSREYLIKGLQDEDVQVGIINQKDMILLTLQQNAIEYVHCSLA